MKKIYYDYMSLAQDGPVALYVDEAEAVPAGVEVYAMQERDKNEEYDCIAKKRGVHFTIFREGKRCIGPPIVSKICYMRTTDGRII